VAEAPPPLIWIDMEMSGLDEATCVILEIAVIVTDAELNEVGDGFHTVIHQPEAALAAMDAWCTEHHAKSGLTAAVRASTTWQSEAEELLLAFLAAHTKAGASPLCGNSVHVDRRFLACHMPRVDAFLHYRIIDVSTLKELVKRWYPALPQYRKGDGHRALDDIRASIGELRYYREKVFLAPPAVTPGA
jgi:oligoribonuclease